MSEKFPILNELSGFITAAEKTASHSFAKSKDRVGESFNPEAEVTTGRSLKMSTCQSS